MAVIEAPAPIEASAPTREHPSTHHSVKRTKRPRRGIALAIVIILAMAIGIPLAVITSRGPSSPPLSSKTPAQVLTIAKAAALAKGSAHTVSDMTLVGHINVIGPTFLTMHSVYDSGKAQGRQVLTGSAGNATFLLLSPPMGYVQGDASYLEQNFNMGLSDAAKHAGQWIAIPLISSSFAPAMTGLSLSSALTGMTPSGTLHLTKQTTVDGVSVIGVAGGLGPYAPNGFTGADVLYISTEAPYLPVENIDHGTNGSGGAFSTTDHLSDYGESVSVSTPAHSTPIWSVSG